MIFFFLLKVSWCSGICFSQNKTETQYCRKHGPRVPPPPPVIYERSNSSPSFETAGREGTTIVGPQLSSTELTGTGGGGGLSKIRKNRANLNICRNECSNNKNCHYFLMYYNEDNLAGKCIYYASEKGPSGNLRVNNYKDTGTYQYQLYRAS